MLFDYIAGIYSGRQNTQSETVPLSERKFSKEKAGKSFLSRFAGADKGT